MKASASGATRPQNHPAVAFGKVGVLLVNLGTPDATDYWSMRRYLKEFLSDRRVIEVPRAIWWPILNLIILTKRPGPKGKDYDAIWNRERDEGPLKTITRAQAEKLAGWIGGGGLGAGGARVVVDWAMRYGNPSIASGVDALREKGCDRILVVPLYPQYAAATTATVGDKLFDHLKTLRWQPAIRLARALCMTIRSISTPWQPRCAPICRNSISSRRRSSSPSTACRRPISTRATRIIASA
jgi:ferrochelatase